MKLYIVNAFSKQIFSGNTAGIIILDKEEAFPDKNTMIKTAAELRYSETAFIKQINNEYFHIRYFTSIDEVDLCGHATIAAFGVLLNCGIVKNDHIYKIQTLAGELAINIENNLIFMDMRAPQEFEQITNPKKLEQLAKIMGISPKEIGMPPQIISTGLPDIILHVKTREILLKLKPDFKALSKLSQEYGVVGLHAFALAKEKRVTAFCRNFAPLHNINEEAATGTSNGALTYYLYKNNIIKVLEKNEFIQGESINRRSVIYTELKKGYSEIQIKVGGEFKVFAKGKIFI